VGSEGSRKTSTYRAICAGVAVHVHLESSRRDVSALSFSVTRENTDGSANARGAGGHKGGNTPAQASNSTLRRGFRCGGREFRVPLLVATKHERAMQIGTCGHRSSPGSRHQFVDQNEPFLRKDAPRRRRGTHVPRTSIVITCFRNRCRRLYSPELASVSVSEAETSRCARR
jgi:hypothetical protein